MIASIIIAIAAVTLLVWLIDRAPKYRVFMLAASFVAAGFWVVLALGFHLHQQQAPAGIDAGFLPAAAILAVTVGYGVRAMWLKRGEHMSSFTLPHVSLRPSMEMSERLAWIEQMKSDPCRRRYAQMIERGDNFWSPARVEYDLDPRATTCCAHLAPIESAMRSTGVRVRLSGNGTADAACKVDPEALAREFTLAPSVRYEELAAYDRSFEDPPQARLSCDACNSRIWVVHATQAGADTKIFPQR